MPAPPVFGLATGQDHNKTIQKLIQLERVPIRRMETSIRQMNGKIQAWKSVQQRVRKLADRSRQLYSFIGPFSLKKVVSSDPGAITGSARSTAAGGKQRMEVLELARHHQIHTNRLDLHKKLPAGKFTIAIGDKSYNYRFRGGPVRALERVIRSRGSDSFDLSRIRINSDTAVLSFRSKVSGQKGAFHFKDPDGLLRHIGLVKFSSQKESTVDLKIDTDRLRPFVRRNGKKDGVPNGTKEAVKKGERPKRGTAKAPADGVLILEGAGAFRLPRALGTHERLSLRVETPPPAVRRVRVGDKEQVVAVGPDISVAVGDVKLKGYNVTRSRTIRGKTAKKTEIAEKNRIGLGLVWRENGREKRHEIVWPADGAVHEQTIEPAKISGGRKVSSLYFFSNNPGVTKFKDIKITSRGGKEGGLVGANEDTPARDARVKIQGIELTRSGNTDLTDIIEGASITLHRRTNGPITVSIEANTETVVKRIHEWVEAYNDLLKFCNQNSKADMNTALASTRSDDPNQSFDEFNRGRGIFASDSTIRRLVWNVRNVTAVAYPSSVSRPYRVLADIGVSTGRPGSPWEEIKHGYLKVDKTKLITALNESPEGVRQLFASDTNEDNRVDNGVAFQMHQNLDPYTRSAGGMIAVRIQMLSERISDNKDRIRKKELSLRVVEEKLRRKFGAMESAIQKTKATQNYLKSRMPGFNPGTEEK